MFRTFPISLILFAAYSLSSPCIASTPSNYEFPVSSSWSEFVGTQNMQKEVGGNSCPKARMMSPPVKDKKFQLFAKKQNIDANLFLDDGGSPNSDRQWLGQTYIFKITGGSKTPSRYLIVMKYLLPTIPDGSGRKYDLARFKTEFQISTKDGGRFDPVIDSIYPVSELLKVNQATEKTLQATIQPQYAGISAGSLQGTVQNTWTYENDLPKVTGVAAARGDINWIYTPARAQRVLYGQKIDMAVISISNDVSASASLTITYGLKYKLSWSGTKYLLAQNSFNLDEAIGPDASPDVIRNALADASPDLIAQVNSLLQISPPPVQSYAFSPDSQFVIEQSSGVVSPIKARLVKGSVNDVSSVVLVPRH